jgi:predicted amidohydrolase YtcJ
VSDRFTILDAEVDGTLVDVVVDSGVVTDVQPRRSGRDGQGGDMIDAGGGALLPGLHDHHLHLLALAAARASVDLGPIAAPDRAALAARLAEADRVLPTGVWLRAVGYHERSAGRLDRVSLDALLPSRPVRVQHRSGHAWLLNSAAIDALGLGPDDEARGVELDANGVPTGMVFGADEWYRDRLPTLEPDLGAVGHLLSAFGVTGVTDATPTDDPAAIALISAAVRRGALPQDVVVTGSPSLVLPRSDDVRPGPAKIVVADHDLPSFDDLLGAFRRARMQGRPVAVHCVTRLALVLALAAWDDVGAVPGDRIEHGAVVPVELDEHISNHGLIVVTQPSFVADRGDDYLADVAPEDQGVLWRCGTLRGSGIGVAGSTDAPFGDPDPWRAIAAAIDRRTPSGCVLGPDDRVSGDEALALFLAPLDDPAGPRRRVGVGTTADLCLLDRPLRRALEDPTAEAVRTVLRAGTVVADR